MIDVSVVFLRAFWEGEPTAVKIYQRLNPAGSPGGSFGFSLHNNRQRQRHRIPPACPADHSDSRYERAIVVKNRTIRGSSPRDFVVAEFWL